MSTLPFDQVVRQMVEELLSSPQVNAPHRRIQSLLKELPDLEELAVPECRYREYEVYVQHTEWLESQVQLLRSLQPLGLSSVPEVAEFLPLPWDYSVLVLRHRVKPGERLLVGAWPSAPFFETAVERFRKELRVLAEQGKLHRFAHVGCFVSSETGTIVLSHSYDHPPDDVVKDEDAMAHFERELASLTETHLIKTNRIHAVFGVPRVLLPVVHPVSWDQALASTQIAVDAGVKGIFLINQGLSSDEVLRLILEVRKRHPSLWVGLNLLGHSPAQVLERGLAACEGRLDGIWSDNANIDEAAPATGQPVAEAFLAARQRLGWNGLYFGGVAFKYQRDVAAEQLPGATRLAAGFMDVICTSGPGTGQHADPTKLAAMRGAVGGGVALALASGVTAENVGHYLPHVNAYLVGTGIEQAFGVLDPLKVAALHRAISMYS